MRVSFMSAAAIVAMALISWPAVAMARHTGSPPGPGSLPTPVPASVVDHLDTLRAEGWTLTPLGQTIASGVAVATDGTGMGLLATTNSRSLAAAHVPFVRASLCKTGNSARTLSADDSRTGGCGFGNLSNLDWESGEGTAYTTWTREDVLENQSFSQTSGYCGDTGCYWYSWDHPPSNLRDEYVDVENFWFAVISDYYC